MGEQMAVRQRPSIPFSYQELTIDGTVRRLTVPDGTLEARVKFLNGPIRYTLDGSTSPVAGALGVPAYDLDQEIWNLAELIRFASTRDGAVNGLAQVHYYRAG